MWVDEQMTILEQLLDRQRLEAEEDAWTTWFKLFTERCKKTSKTIAEVHGYIKASAWLEFAYDWAQSKKPSDVQPFTKIIRRRVRRLALGNDMEALREFAEELRPLIGKAQQQAKPRLRKKPRRKKRKGLPDGKYPLPGLQPKDEEEE
jgi:hypothetical protein